MIKKNNADNLEIIMQFFFEPPVVGTHYNCSHEYLQCTFKKENKQILFL